MIFECESHVRSPVPPEARVDTPIVAANIVRTVTGGSEDFIGLYDPDCLSQARLNWPAGYIPLSFSQTYIVDAVVFSVAIPMDDLFPGVISCEECRSN